MEGLKLPLSGVHFSTPLEYIPLQHPFMHWEFEEHCTQSPREPVVGGVGDGGFGELVHGPFWQHAPQWSAEVPHHCESLKRIRFINDREKRLVALSVRFWSD